MKGVCSFEQIKLHIMIVFRRLTGGMTRDINEQVQPEMQKLKVSDFISTL